MVKVEKKIFRSAVKGIFSRFLSTAKIVGFVEQFDESGVSGWAIHRDGAAIDFALKVNGRVFPLKHQSVERLDVAHLHGNQFVKAGFQAAIDPAIASAIEVTGTDGSTVEILANGTPIKRIPKLQTDWFGVSRLTTERLNIDIKTAELLGKIESWGHFGVRGWVHRNGVPAVSFGLTCNRVSHECSTYTVSRPDIAKKFGIRNTEIGFEIELPGYFWDSVSDNESMQLELQIEGTTVAIPSIVLSRRMAAKWVSDIVRLGKGKERQYKMILALEHAHYGRLYDVLDERDTIEMSQFAASMRLDKFAPPRAVNFKFLEVNGPTAATVMQWKALRALNDRLSAGSSAFSLVKVILEEHRLGGRAREQYLLSVVPLLCRSGEFEAMRELIDFSQLHGLASREDLWHRSLALPALVADGLVGEASELLWDLAKHHHAGWLNTECVLYSLECVTRTEREGMLAQIDAEKFRYSLIGLLEGFKGEWFSRLHDKNLIDCMIKLVEGVRSYSNPLREDAVRAAIRVYGLNSTFWVELQKRGIAASGELVHAQQAWTRLEQSILEANVLNNLRVICRQLDFFARYGNPEVILYLRDIAAYVLPELNNNFADMGRELLERLLAAGPIEALRLVATPLSHSNHIALDFPETSERLLTTLRINSERHLSKVYDLQTEAAALLTEARRLSPQGEVNALAALLDRLADKATQLSNGAGHFLGADVFAHAYVISRQAGLPSERYLRRLHQVTRLAVEKASPIGYMPAPTCAAIARLMQAPQDIFITSLLQDMQFLAEERYGARHNTMFAPPVDGLEALRSNGVYGDTLVVVYSCRKYLDTRVAAIRQTWIEDLRKREIPYVILVGDGDDTLQGDVLALDVSDLYEDLPKKSLKLFEWIYRNTNAQYVLKIDDDCYLDVPRYFDTLSYRKHHYYGRIIHRAEGSTDRIWHQAKSYSEHGRKSIDKSPEPSIYADGGGGYCLSRMAMASLLEAKITLAGRRLIANSFMEDKLIGDLLSLKGIHPSNEDYESYQRRRTFSDAIPVGMWENTFLPSRVTPTKIVHLDTENDFQRTRERTKSDEVWPKKVWPTAWPPSIKLHSNQLELISDPVDAVSLLQVDLVAVAVVRNEMTMLEHFLKHYRDLGLKCFVFIDNCSDDGTREYLAQQPDVVLYSADTEYKRSHYGVAWQQAVLGNHCLNKWVLLVDADELLVYDECETKPLASFVREIESEGADGVRIDMIDMYPYGDLAEADFSKNEPFVAAPWFDKDPVIPWRLGNGYFSNCVGTTSSLRHRQVPHAVPHDFVSQKFALFRYRPWVRMSQGLHYASGLKVSAQRAWFGHFKYHAGFKEKVLKEVKRGQHFNNAFEYERYAVMLAEGRGAFGDSTLSTRFSGSGSFSSLARTG